MNSHEVFIHIHQGCFAGTGAIRLPQCQWSKPDGYGTISQCITTTKHSKAKFVCIFLGIYCKHLELISWPLAKLSLLDVLYDCTTEIMIIAIGCPSKNGTGFILIASVCVTSKLLFTDNTDFINNLRRRKMTAISQTTFSDAFSWMKIYEFRLTFIWNLFLRAQLSIFQYWFR